MCDGEPCAKRFKKWTVKTNKRTSSDFAKHRKSRERRERRKRSTTRYYKDLKRKRSDRSSEELLCEAASEIYITDNMAAGNCDNQMKEVADWEKQNQLAYWKSRALSLELENTILHRCLRNSYAKQVWDYETYMKTHDAANIDGENNATKENEMEEKESIEKNENLPPKEGLREEVRNVMERLYGRMAPKIIGMETAVQLNYELQVDQHKPPYWPNIALNL